MDPMGPEKYNEKKKPRGPPNLNNCTIFATISLDIFGMSREKVTSLFVIIVMDREKVMGLYKNHMQLDTICQIGEIWTMLY